MRLNSALTDSSPPNLALVSRLSSTPLRTRVVWSFLGLGLSAVLFAVGLLVLLIVWPLDRQERRMTHQQAGAVVNWLQDQQGQLSARTRSWAELPDPLLVGADLLSAGDVQAIALLSNGRITTALIASGLRPADWQPGTLAPRQRFAVQGGKVWMLARASQPSGTELLLMRVIDAGRLSPSPFVTQVKAAP
ncbi:hypothetical protein E7T06_08690 [Deinococcus sp. Arct2-2]|uniref:hypothetical protein n=1 Tax=Deinococcus sp. Arct2-2 TaxID=2568653 RepID=UPI0010A490E3|nr:hypothetical protein [Deinococcus sp. Arct2-2]THF70120.1 hypothetical protein E7T06_08690 [Deinococcus sp. Arct2-2]